MYLYTFITFNDFFKSHLAGSLQTVNRKQTLIKKRNKINIG